MARIVMVSHLGV